MNHRHENKQRWGTNTERIYETLDSTNKQELHQRNRLGMISRKTIMRTYAKYYRNWSEEDYVYFVCLKWRYPYNATTTAYNSPEAPKRGEMNKNKQTKRHIWNHKRTNKDKLQQRNRPGMVSRKTCSGLNYSRVKFKGRCRQIYVA